MDNLFKTRPLEVICFYKKADSESRVVLAEATEAPLYTMLTEVGLGWECLFSDIRITCFPRRYTIMVCNFYICRGCFTHCLAFLAFCMFMVSEFSCPTGFIHMHLSELEFIQFISNFKLLFNFHQTRTSFSPH